MKKLSTVFILVFLNTIVLAQWTKKANVPGSSRHHPVTFTIGNNAYYLTGVNSTDDLLKDFYKYDPTNDSWTKLTDFPGAARGFAYGASLDGKGYIGMGVSDLAYLNDLWEYNPVNDTWTQLASMPGIGRIHPAFVAFEGKIFVGLGGSQSGNLRDWYVYTIATNTWKKGPDLPAIARHHPYYFHAGDYVYTGFGHSITGILKDFWRYNIDNDTWTQMNNFPGEARVAGTQFSYNDKGYILCGDGEDHLNLDEGEFYEYDHINDSWNELPPAPGQSRWAPGSFVIGDKAYLTSGETGNNVLYNDLWVYDLNMFNSTEEIANSNKTFSVFPNPATSEIQLPSWMTNEELQTLQIFDAQGKVVTAGIASNNKMDVSNLIPQLYFISIFTSNGEVYQARFLRQ